MLKEKATSAKFQDTYDLETRLKMVANLEKKYWFCKLGLRIAYLLSLRRMINALNFQI